LNYDINQALDPVSWNSKFCIVSLYGSIEYLASDVKNIKDSFHRMGKYIQDKSIIKENPNGVGKAV